MNETELKNEAQQKIAEAQAREAQLRNVSPYGSNHIPTANAASGNQSQQPVIPPNFQIPPIEQIPVDNNALEILQQMGFPENRARKALILNHMNAEAAAEWLLRFIDDPYADAPLTIQELMQSYPQLFYPKSQPKPIGQDILHAIQVGCCTFCVTRNNFANQKWYYSWYRHYIGSSHLCILCQRS